MGTRDDSEKILRELHVMVSKGQTLPNDSNKVIVDRQKMVNLFSDLDKTIYKMMEEYELTTQSRDRAEREFTKHGESIVKNACNKAEDIYAASVMYTDEALVRIQDIIRETNDTFNKLYSDMQHKLQTQEGIVKENQLELKGQLQDLMDTNKYLQIIEDRNREISKEKERKEKKDGLPKKKTPSIYADRMTEIKVNAEYMEKMGYANRDTEDSRDETSEMISEDAIEIELDEPMVNEKASTMQKSLDDSKEDDDLTFIDDFKRPDPPQIKVDTNADYFRWKEKKDSETEDKWKEPSEKEKESSDAIHKVWKNFRQGKKS